MSKRKIKLDGKVHDFDMSDGRDKYPFSMSGTGSMRIYIDGKKCFYDGYVENKSMLDGKINFKKVITPGKTTFKVNDPRYEEVQEIHKLSPEQIKDIDRNKRLKNSLFAIKYEPIRRVNSGAYFGKELTFFNICVTFDANRIVVFKSSHNGYWSPNYIRLTKEEDEQVFYKFSERLKQKILNFFNLTEGEIAQR